MHAIRMEHITKRFGSDGGQPRHQLSSCARASILSLLGENGSGKTTLMNMLSGIYYPDEGQIYMSTASP